MLKKLITVLLICSLFVLTVRAENADAQVSVTQGPEVNCKSAILMERETGRILYAKNENEALPPASVTKVMTLLLIAEAIEEGRLSLDDEIAISQNAASMGGSQVFLEEGERMRLEDVLKCTVIASANDAAVALAEHHSGSESAFVDAMMRRAQELGLEGTKFENTTGLDDTTTQHVMCAKDIAVISRELLSHECIRKYAGLWQDSIRDGEFILTNTNRLVRYYPGCTGLKTGSTDKAGFCISASAKRGEMELIAVVMGAPTRDERNRIARELLDFGFASYGLYQDGGGYLEDADCIRGTKASIPLWTDGFMTVVDKRDVNRIERIYDIPKEIQAPIEKGTVVGSVTYRLDGEDIGRADIYANESVAGIGYGRLLIALVNFILCGRAI